jgi:hypothetical protein
LSENRTFQQRFGTRKETTTTWQRQKVDWELEWPNNGHKGKRNGKTGKKGNSQKEW